MTAGSGFSADGWEPESAALTPFPAWSSSEFWKGRIESSDWPSLLFSKKKTTRAEWQVFAQFSGLQLAGDYCAIRPMLQHRRVYVRWFTPLTPPSSTNLEMKIEEDSWKNLGWIVFVAKSDAVTVLKFWKLWLGEDTACSHSAQWLALYTRIWCAILHSFKH